MVEKQEEEEEEEGGGGVALTSWSELSRGRASALRATVGLAVGTLLLEKTMANRGGSGGWVVMERERERRREKERLVDGEVELREAVVGVSLRGMNMGCLPLRWTVMTTRMMM